MRTHAVSFGQTICLPLIFSLNLPLEPNAIMGGVHGSSSSKHDGIQPKTARIKYRFKFKGYYEGVFDSISSVCSTLHRVRPVQWHSVIKRHSAVLLYPVNNPVPTWI